MYKIITSLIVSLFFISTQSHAQELNCKCNINTPKLQKTDPKVFEDLQNVIEEFLNNQKWTDDTYEPEEKIDCNFLLTIVGEGDNNIFSAELSLQASRPVYGSTYKTPIFSHQDKNIKFLYEQQQPIIYSEGSYLDNLSSLLSFYAYLIIGLDYDSFSPYGGEDYLVKAQEILNTVPQSAASQFGGWGSADGTTNRYWIMESMLSPKTKPLRLAFYDYHRSALDIMYENVEVGKVVMLSALDKVKDVNESYQNAMVVKMFAQAKGNELVEIFKKSTLEQKNKVYDVLVALDPSNASKYNQVKRK